MKDLNINKCACIIGAGLSGCEAAWQLAKAGVQVKLFEMRPEKTTPAHTGGGFAELVCSNSLRSDSMENAVGLLKEEMRAFDSLIMMAADKSRVPAGSALAVDREEFSRIVETELTALENIEVIHQEIADFSQLPEHDILIIASGPLSSDAICKTIAGMTSSDYLHFYDAVAPIIFGESVNYDIAYWASRYDKGDADYLNCPMDAEQYMQFYNELITAETFKLRDFEQAAYFEGCMPVEVMAKRGVQTLLFGPLKPVGLNDPHTGLTPHAVVQLRKENTQASLFNLVGFQTSLTRPEQKRVFSMIPGLENVEFARYGMIHRNTFINSPEVLLPTLQMKSDAKILFAGQITGVEGYVESAASGLVAGYNAARILHGEEPLVFPKETAHGALMAYITAMNRDFQPMNVNFGIFPPLENRKIKKSQRKLMYSERAMEIIQTIPKISN